MADRNSVFGRRHRVDMFGRPQHRERLLLQLGAGIEKGGPLIMLFAQRRHASPDVLRAVPHDIWIEAGIIHDVTGGRTTRDVDMRQQTRGQNWANPLDLVLHPLANWVGRRVAIQDALDLLLHESILRREPLDGTVRLAAAIERAYLSIRADASILHRVVCIDKMPGLRVVERSRSLANVPRHTRDGLHFHRDTHGNLPHFVSLT